MNTIWRKKGTLEMLAQLSRNTMAAHLGIQFTEIGSDYLKATMPVDKSTHQPMGLLHGGASAALAETVASMAGNLAVDESKFCVGVEINANHVRSATNGYVTGIARPLALGQTIQVWEIKIVDENRKLICISRLTLAVKKKKI
jgi:1,4-dihydroxy-2-naphthoyl-CoA hydrolase